MVYYRGQQNAVITKESVKSSCKSQYIILNNGILKLNSSVLPSSEGYISQYTPSGVYGLIVNEINEVNINLILVKII